MKHLRNKVYELKLYKLLTHKNIHNGKHKEIIYKRCQLRYDRQLNKFYSFVYSTSLKILI